MLITQHNTERYSPLLRVLGVRESFTVPDLARALAALHEGSRGPLPSLDLQQAIGLLRALQKVRLHKIVSCLTVTPNDRTGT